MPDALRNEKHGKEVPTSMETNRLGIYRTDLSAPQPPRAIGVSPVPESVQALPFDGARSVILCRWHPGEAERCRMCAPGRCMAYRDSCMTRHPGLITEEEVLRRSALGLRWPEDQP